MIHRLIEQINARIKELEAIKEDRQSRGLGVKFIDDMLQQNKQLRNCLAKKA